MTDDLALLCAASICATSKLFSSPPLLIAVRGRPHDVIITSGAAVKNQCTGIRSLSLEGRPKNLGNLLAAVGPSLESIKNSSDCPSDSCEIKQVQAPCPNLSNVSLEVIYDTQSALPDYADLLCSYCPKLKFATMGELPVPLCTQVVSVCPNMRCLYHIGYSALDGAFDTLAAIGPSLKELEYIARSTDFNDLRLGLAMRLCSSLVRVDLDSTDLTSEQTVHGIKQLFDDEIPLLSSADEFSDAVMKTGQRAGTLHKFSFSGRVEGKGAFQAFVQGAPLLRNVTLFVGSRGELSRT